MEVRRINIGQLTGNAGQIEGLPANPRQWTQTEIDRLAKSLKETPELFEMRPLLVYQQGEEYVILGGNLRYEGAKKNKMQDCPAIVIPADTPVEKLKEIVIKDNGSFGEWDVQALASDWNDIDLSSWGVNAIWDEVRKEDLHNSETEQETIERMKKEFEERMAAGEISEEDEEYQEFLDKFKLKKTTDDCYTPAPVYDAVARYVEETYGVSRANFVRPFYPGGDYQKENYPCGCVVVDNPPFSIMAEILQFYHTKGVSFFLFAPTLTLFSSSSSCTALPCNLSVIYENGASVNTSFLTNLEDRSIRLKSAPRLQELVQGGIDEFAKTLRKQLPKYSYPQHIITSSWVGALSRLGIEFSVPVAESEGIGGLDSQKASGKAIYGKGYIVSDRVKAEREKAEREKAEVWELSEKEYKIIERLNRGR